MRDIRGLLLGVGAAMALAAGAYAQNGGDQCSGATAVGEGSFAFDNTGFATDQVPACGFNGANDMFYSYTPSATGTATISTCGTSFDTILSAYDSCGGAQLACLDDFCGLQTTITLAVTQGVPVIIEVSGYNGAFGAGTLNISMGGGGVPANDNCGAAQAVGEGTFPFDTTLATNDGTGSCGASAGSPDVWFAYTAGSTGNATAAACGSFYDTVLVAFDTCNGTEMVCNDDSCGLQSSITFPVTQGTTYLIRCAGFGGDIGQGTLAISIAEPCVLQYPAGAVPEVELCGEDLNGGCNAVPTPVYDSIAMNSAVHGTAWANAGTRDTDWYTINLGAGQTITVCGSAEFDFVNYVVQLVPDCTNIQIPGIGGGVACATSTITFTAPSDGTYIIFVATSGFDTPACNATGNNYWVSVRDDNTCPEVGGAQCDWQSVGCVADYNGSGGTPDDADVAAFFSDWNAGDECADANQSGGTPDDADITTFFGLWNAGGC